MKVYGEDRITKGWYVSGGGKTNYEICTNKKWVNLKITQAPVVAWNMKRGRGGESVFVYGKRGGGG